MLTQSNNIITASPKIGKTSKFNGYIIKLKNKHLFRSISSENIIKSQELVKVSSSEAENLQKQNKIIYKVPNYIRHSATIPNDTYFKSQFALKKISAPIGWDYEKGFNNQVTVAVVDSGVDLRHPDLRKKIINGFDFVNNDAIPQDDNGHGTHVTGIIAAQTNNKKGISGVSWGANIMPVKVLDSYNSGEDFNIIKGITYSVDNGAKIINLSLGGGDYSKALEDATTYAYNKGVLVFAASGNTGNSGISYPAGNANVIGVAATDKNDKRARFSNYNSNVDISAPGVNILSTYFIGNYRFYAHLDGTSMSTAFASGVAAVLLSKKPYLSPGQLTNDILMHSNDLGPPGRDDYYGLGRINLSEALNSERSLLYINGKQIVNYGDSVYINGSIYPEMADNVINVKIKRLSDSSYGKEKKIETNKNGIFSFTDKPSAGIIYSFKSPGGNGIYGSSGKLTVKVKPKITLISNKLKARKKASVIITGSVLPKHPGKHLLVYINNLKKREVKRVSLKNKDNKSVFRLLWRPHSKGTFRLFARFGDKDHLPNNSRLIKIKVY